MTVKERLHALIETLDEAQAEALLAFATRDPGLYPPLTSQQAQELQRRLDQHDPHDVISNEEVFRRFDVASEAPDTEKWPPFRALTEGEIQGIRSAMSEDGVDGLTTEQLLESLGIAVD